MIKLNANGAVIAPRMVRWILSELEKKALWDPLGQDADKLICKMHTMQKIAWEDSSFNVTQVIKSELSERAGDMFRKHLPMTIGGIPINEDDKMPESEIRFECDGRPLAAIVNLETLRAYEGAEHVG